VDDVGVPNFLVESGWLSHEASVHSSFGGILAL
jgi:hypothetical protein